MLTATVTTPFGYLRCVARLPFAVACKALHIVNTPALHLLRLNQWRGEENTKKQENTHWEWRFHIYTNFTNLLYSSHITNSCYKWKENFRKNPGPLDSSICFLFSPLFTTSSWDWCVVWKLQCPRIRPQSGLNLASEIWHWCHWLLWHHKGFSHCMK